VGISPEEIAANLGIERSYVAALRDSLASELRQLGNGRTSAR